MNQDSFDLIVTIAELDEAIAWAVEILGNALNPKDLDDGLVHCDLEQAMRDEILSQRVRDALTIFKQVLDGELNQPKEIYDKLVAIDLDYTCIGMNPLIDQRNDSIQQRDFCEWHEINFNPLTQSLIEFEVIEDPTLKFYQSLGEFSENEQEQFLSTLGLTH